MYCNGVRKFHLLEVTILYILNNMIIIIIIISIFSISIVPREVLSTLEVEKSIVLTSNTRKKECSSVLRNIFYIYRGPGSGVPVRMNRQRSTTYMYL